MSSHRGRVAAPSQPERINVVLVHEYQFVAEALVAVLLAQPDLEAAATRSDPELVAACVRQTGPAVVILDSLNGGIQLAAALRAEHPDLRILVLVPAFRQDTLLACVQAGAVGWLARDTALAELAPAIRRVHRGEVLFAPHLLADLLARQSYVGPPPERQHLTQLLGPREVTVLQALATGLTTEQAADRLSISVHTVRTHVKNVMSKLQVHSKVEAVVVALRQGLISLPERPEPPEEHAMTGRRSVGDAV